MGSWQSRKWGAGEFGAPVVTSLDSAVAQLNPKTKQAMYAAANKGLIKRGTWDNCAFNAGGIEVGNTDVRSYQSAAATFGVSPTVVINFIKVWDGLGGSDQQATEKLKEAILKAGLYTEPNESAGRRILRETVYKSYETRMKEQFDALVEGLDLDDVEHELVSDMKEVAELLSV